MIGAVWISAKPLAVLLSPEYREPALWAGVHLRKIRDLISCSRATISSRRAASAILPLAEIECQKARNRVLVAENINIPRCHTRFDYHGGGGQFRVIDPGNEFVSRNAGHHRARDNSDMRAER